MKRFLPFLAVALVLELLAAAIRYLHAPLVPAVLFAIIPAFALLSYLLLGNIRKAAEKSPTRFVTAFMGAVSVKLLLTAAFLGIYLYFFREQRVSVALGTFVVYVAFTSLLVVLLRRES